MKRLVVLIFILCGNMLGAQEFNCQITVTSTPAMSPTANELEVFQDLENNIKEFMNTTVWTDDFFEIEERINLSILITLSEKNGTDGYGGTIQFQATRPVYNTAYNTITFNHIDKDFNITYLRNTALLFSIDRYRSNLTSMLAFYAYMILGYDYDSFSLKGGTDFFIKAQQIANNAKQYLPDSDWDPKKKGNRNTRYYLVDNAIQSLFEPIRTTYYNYHRLGLDIMYDNPEEARKVILQSITALDRVQRARPGSLNLQVFFNTKSGELINLFSQASDARQKNTAVNILKRLDPINASKYEDIL
jgi:hypothetical protein